MSEIKKPRVEIINSHKSIEGNGKNNSETPTIQVSEYTKSFHKLLPVKNDNIGNNEENTDWFALARKLRQDNRQIIKTLLEREEELALVKEQLQAQITKIERTEILKHKHEEELHSAQAQIKKLLQELKETQEELDYKQKEEQLLRTDLNSYKQDLEILKSQVKTLENNYQKEREINQNLEEKNQELKLRLQREQRHNLEFKAALSDSVETSEPIESIKIKEKQPISNSLISPKSPIPKPVGIKPWSESLETEDTLLETSENHELENHSENLQSKEQFIPQLKVLNENITPPIKENKPSPSPLINNSKYRSKSREKRTLMLPQFPKLNLNNEM